MNKLLIAAAGAGKTTYLINKALEMETNVLITTFTIENTNAIKHKFINKIGYVPSHITVQSWFSFLIQHGVKPFQGSVNSILHNTKIRGLNFSNKRSGLIPGKISRYYSENMEFINYYFDERMRINSDKLSKFVIRANENTNGKVIERLISIYPNIFIDEIQDLAGYDLEIIKLLFQSNIQNVLLVGDPRQTTYTTHWEQKNKKYNYGGIEKFINEQCRSIGNISIDKVTLKNSHRNNSIICNLSSLLYDSFPITKMCTCNTCHPERKHNGIYIVKKENAETYWRQIQPIVLRNNKNTKIMYTDNIYNFGDVKGREFNDVMIYPTGKMLDWLLDNNKSIDSQITKAKLYVAITRAKYSVAFVVSSSEYDQFINNPQFINWRPDR